jgi:hypothetical protein
MNIPVPDELSPDGWGVMLALGIALVPLVRSPQLTPSGRGFEDKDDALSRSPRIFFPKFSENIKYNVYGNCRFLSCL